jgi:hypothetical protein
VVMRSHMALATGDYRSLTPPTDDGIPVAEWLLIYRASSGAWVVAYLSDAVNVSHAVAVKPSVPPSRLVVSLTRITPSDATSMHWPPFASL